MKTDVKDLNYYLRLGYKIEITPDEDGDGFNASIPQLKGCMAFGESVEEAYETLLEVKQAWFSIALERGWKIPEPVAASESDNFMLRLPSDLHHELIELADKSQTTLNQLIIALIRKARPLAPQQTMLQA